MNYRIRADRPTMVVGCSLGFVVLLVLYWVVHFWLLRQDFAGEIAAIQPRTARILGIQESFDQLNMAANEADSRLQELVYPADRASAMTAAAMQQSIREVMTDAGLSVSGSQVLPARAVGGFDRLSLDITAEGNIGAFDDAFAILDLMRPMVFVESVSVKPSRNRNRNRRSDDKVEGNPRKLTARLHLFSLRIVK